MSLNVQSDCLPHSTIIAKLNEIPDQQSHEEGESGKRANLSNDFCKIIELDLKGSVLGLSAKRCKRKIVGTSQSINGQTYPS